MIGEAIAANEPVLLVDVNTRHIADEIARHTGIATDGDHVAYLILTHRNTTAADEHAVFSIISNKTAITLTAWAYFDPNDTFYKILVNNYGCAFIGTPVVYNRIPTFGEQGLYQRSIRSTLTCSIPAAFVQDSSPKNTHNETEAAYSRTVSLFI